MNTLLVLLLLAFSGTLLFVYLGYRTYIGYLNMLYRRSMNNIQREATKYKAQKPVAKKHSDEYMSREVNTRQAAKNAARGLEQSLHATEAVREQIAKIQNAEQAKFEQHDLEIYDPVTRTTKERVNTQVQSQEYSAMTLANKYKDARIVGVVEPIGIWTRFVIKQQGMWLAMRQAFHGDKGFWQNIIKAQATGQLYEQSKGKTRGM